MSMRLRNVLIALLVLLPLSFYAGYKTNRAPAVGKTNPNGRKILYYVDPMNPSFRSSEPGVAPCGMALEPVCRRRAGRARGRWRREQCPFGPTGSNSSA
jgi:hypothetical protein